MQEEGREKCAEPTCDKIAKKYSNKEKQLTVRQPERDANEAKPWKRGITNQTQTYKLKFIENTD